MPLYDIYKQRFGVIVGALENARRINRFGHAFLLHADRAKTRLEFSRVLAQIGGCPNPNPDGSPCLACGFCTHIEAGTYPELAVLTPIGKMYQIQVGDRENPEPNTVRSFTNRFYLTSISGAARKIGVIFDADRMGVEAQNALLKTLEEPPRESLIVLATGNPGALLPTTRSRCQTLMLLENTADLDFAGAAELRAVLCALVAARGDLGRAEQCATGLITLAGGLKNDAETRLDAEYEARLSDAAEFDERLAKRLSKQRDDAASGAYMAERAAFLAAIHDFFARRYLLASGADASDVPEADSLGGVAGAEDAKRDLDTAGELLYTLNFNVNESLALRTFAIKIALAGMEK